MAKEKTKLQSSKIIVPQEMIERKIFFIRGKKVMIDRDLAELYGIETKALNQAVSRNLERFPDTFMFRLTKVEAKELVTFCDRLKTMRFSSVTPRVFTEHGVAMLASVLKSERAVKISIHIVNTFIQLREFITSHKELAYKLKELEEKIGKHDKEISTIVEVIKRLIVEPPKKKEPIGFHPIVSKVL